MTDHLSGSQLISALHIEPVKANILSSLVGQDSLSFLIITIRPIQHFPSPRHLSTLRRVSLRSWPDGLPGLDLALWNLDWFDDFRHLGL